MQESLDKPTVKIPRRKNKVQLVGGCGKKDKEQARGIYQINQTFLADVDWNF